MMKQNQHTDAFASLLTEALEERTDGLPEEDEMLMRMQAQIRKAQKEEKTMKKAVGKKVVIAAAAICALGSITAVAAGKLATVETHSSHKDTVTSYTAYEELAEKYLPDMRAVETFENGYTFQEAVPGFSTGSDAEGNKTGDWVSLNVTYTKDDAPDVNLTAEPTASLGDLSTEGEQVTVDGMTFSWDETSYLTLPPDQELTEEQEEAMVAGELQVAYGSDVAKQEQLQSVSWEQDGVTYQLFAFGDVGEETMLDMAAEVAAQ